MAVVVVLVVVMVVVVVIYIRVSGRSKRRSKLIVRDP